MDKLQPITRNLPGFIRDPIVSVIVRPFLCFQARCMDCFTTLIYNTDLGDRRCIQYSISKALGLAIVLGGSIVKLPQIIKIINARSARGVSLASYLLDTSSTAIVVAYNVRNSFPWSTYGENIFLLAQNVVIIGLIVLYSTEATAPLLLLLSALGLMLAYVLSSRDLLPLPHLSLLLSASIPLTLSSKVPQILEIQKNRSTGQLSGFLVASQVLGCLARVFTTLTETGDRVLWWGFFLTTLMNAMIAVQMWVYWDNSKTDSVDLGKRAYKHKVSGELKPKVKSSPKPAPFASNSGDSMDALPRKAFGSSPSSVRKYVRKLDG
ncbi:BQ5605_C013g07174 [Microbotryum silenes-dioicae]|uniref:BQ5605_C013g07174 protein n=1 Tax=Microbotryum silenes-dioicae TaxID=796604 RepID=A0A2X0MCD7_9BASI|nr:BQ5605_C013g07174 [Microbotryum silenes-dioicae]